MLVLLVTFFATGLQASQSDFARGRVLDAPDGVVVARLVVPDDVYESIILEEQDQDSTWRHIPADQITYDMP